MTNRAGKQNTGALLFTAVYEGTKPQDLSEYLKAQAGISGRSLRKYFFRGLVFVNQRKAHSAAAIKPGDTVKVLLPKEQGSLTAEDIPLDIIFENGDLLVLNKPARLAVHPAGSITSGTLAHGVAAYFAATGLKVKVRPVNRLDFGTSGLVIFAKNAQIQADLSRAIREHRIIRLYYAVVQGVPAAATGIINQPIAAIVGKRAVETSGQPAETHYRVMQRYPEHCLLELNLVTGRTHQIRVHLSHEGLPILGDPQYGVKSPFMQRPALHAGKLNFAASGLNIPELEAPFPADFRFLLERVGSQSTKSGTT